MRESKVDETWLYKCYRFARQTVDEINSNLEIRRNPRDIYLNVFMGKVGQVGVYLYLKKHFPTIMCTEPDFSIKADNIWNTEDFAIQGIKVDVKAINEKSGFFMMETKKFLDNGEYAYKNSNNEEITIDAYIVVKVLGSTVPYKEITTINPKEFFKKKTCTVKILGGITRNNFWKRKHFLPKGTRCNRINLKAACMNLPLEKVGGNSTSNAVQTDNYILDVYRELKDITDVLKLK